MSPRASSDLAAELRLLPHVMLYELQKASAFRVGFVLKELLHGIARPTVMGFVYFAMFSASDQKAFNGYRFVDLIGYLVFTTALSKCVMDERSLDLAEQIFDGYVTKYLVMPLSFFTLLWGRFFQFSLLQLGAAALFYLVGALALPAYWPDPASAVAVLQAGVLLALGAACHFLALAILNLLAFWLDVVWSLTNMFRFVTLFVSGTLVPIALMPDSVNHALSCLFPYWTVFAPAELLLGRMGTDDFLRGLFVLLLSLAGLLWLARFTWQRGIARYAGVGA